MKKRLLGLILVVLMVFPFVMNASGEEASGIDFRQSSRRGKAPGGSGTVTGAVDEHFGQGRTGRAFGQSWDQHLRLF